MGLGQKDSEKASTVTMMAYRFYGMPTAEQAHMLSQIAGSCRFLWNRMLADASARYEAGEKFFIPTPANYKKIPGLEWLKGMDSIALANVHLRLNAALLWSSIFVTLVAKKYQLLFTMLSVPHKVYGIR